VPFLCAYILGEFIGAERDWFDRPDDSHLLFSVLLKPAQAEKREGSTTLM